MLKVKHLDRAIAFNEFMERASEKQVNQVYSQAKGPEVQKKNTSAVPPVKRKVKKVIK